MLGRREFWVGRGCRVGLHLMRGLLAGCRLWPLSSVGALGLSHALGQSSVSGPN